MTKIKNTPYDKFQKALLKSEAKEERWSALRFANIEPTLNLWDSMSNRSKGMVLSDSRWNHYPMFSYTKGSRKRFGYIISMLVERAVNSGDKETLRPLINKSEGVFAIHMLDKATSSVRLKMAKRLMNSPDSRVRTRCARILPVKHMKKMLDDKHYSVRNIAITRIGLDNCYKEFIPATISPETKDSGYWYRSWLGRQALRLSDKDELSDLIDEARNLDLSKVDIKRWDVTLAALISRLTPEEALYFMGFGEENPYIKRALQEKMDFR